MASEDEIRAALEKAFDYRGDVTITLRTGQTVQGYLFDRNGDSPALAECFIRILPPAGEPVKVPYDQIAALAFTGRDTAAGRSWETWVRNYQKKKAAGETNIRIDPEKLEE